MLIQSARAIWGLGYSGRGLLISTLSVQGVFNINRGYTIFRKIEILNSNDEFYTVAKGTDYGLSVYDHIVLDASSVAGNGVVIYQ